MLRYIVGRVLQAVLVLWAAYTVTSVSYTHLTLPTILLV